MLENNSPQTDKDIVVGRIPIEIIITSEGWIPLSLFLPSLEDILEMKALTDTHFSLKEHAQQAFSEFKLSFKNELESLEKKSDRFSDSPIFLNRLANFAELSDQMEKEAQYLNLAKNLSNDPFFDHRIGDNLISKNQPMEAEKLFLSLDLKNDIYANLRLAYFSIQRDDFNAASVFVHNALEIDYLDYSARMIEGVLNLVGGDYELAIQNFRVAAGEQKGSASLYVNMAVAYLFLGQQSKAFATIMRAITLEPLNANAIILLADLAFAEKRNEDALPSLKHFLKFEQKSPAIWARLARTLLCLGKINEAIDALKHQGSFSDSSAIWNNLGVAYIEQRDYQKAYGALSHALLKKLDRDSKEDDYLLAARNFCQLLAIKNDFKDLLNFSTLILRENNQIIIKKDRYLSDIIAFNLHSLRKLGKKNEFITLSESLLNEDNVTPRLKAWVISELICHYTSIEDGNPIAVQLSKRFDHVLNELGKQDSDRKEQLINNIAYVYAEAGHLNDSARYINYLSLKIHKEPFPTATLGLLNFRKGNLEKGRQLYSEAIALALNESDKNRIRQKLNFELAKILIDQNQDATKINRLLDKVIKQRGGADEIATMAKNIKNRRNLKKLTELKHNYQK